MPFVLYAPLFCVKSKLMMLFFSDQLRFDDNINNGGKHVLVLVQKIGGKHIIIKNWLLKNCGLRRQDNPNPLKANLVPIRMR